MGSSAAPTPSKERLWESSSHPLSSYRHLHGDNSRGLHRKPSCTVEQPTSSPRAVTTSNGKLSPLLDRPTSSRILTHAGAGGDTSRIPPAARSHPVTQPQTSPAALLLPGGVGFLPKCRVEVGTLLPSLPCPRSSCAIPHTWQSKPGIQPGFASASPPAWQRERSAPRCPGASLLHGNGRWNDLESGYRRNISLQHRQAKIKDISLFFQHLFIFPDRGRIIPYLLKS